MNNGTKFDEGKHRMDLITSEFMFAVAMVLTYGAKKYGERNWEKGMKWGRVYAAAMRHLWAWWGGAGPTTTSFLFGSLDEETKMPHLWHAACCIMFLITFEERAMTDYDDRPQENNNG